MGNGEEGREIGGGLLIIELMNKFRGGRGLEKKRREMLIILVRKKYLQRRKRGKATGLDGIAVGVLKMVGEVMVKFLRSIKE